MRKSTRTDSNGKRLRALRHALDFEESNVTRFASGLGISRNQFYRAFKQPHLVHRRIHDAIDAMIAKHAKRKHAA